MVFSAINIFLSKPNVASLEFSKMFDCYFGFAEEITEFKTTKLIFLTNVSLKNTGTCIYKDKSFDKLDGFLNFCLIEIEKIKTDIANDIIGWI